MLKVVLLAAVWQSHAVQLTSVIDGSGRIAKQAVVDLARRPNPDDKSSENKRRTNTFFSYAPHTTGSHEEATFAPGVPAIFHFMGPDLAETVVDANRILVPPGTEFRYYNYAAMDEAAFHIGRELEAAGLVTWANFSSASTNESSLFLQQFRAAELSPAYAAFRSLRPVAFRADILRVMVLWRHGGLYADGKIRLMTKVGPDSTVFEENLMKTNAGNNFLICRDFTVPFLSNSLILAAPGEPVLLPIILKIVSNVLTRYRVGSVETHRQSVLRTTGPGAIYEALFGADGANPHPLLPSPRCKYGNYSSLPSPPNVTCEKKMVDEQSVVALACSDQTVRMSVKTGPQGNSFDDLWDQGQEYCEKNYTGTSYDPCGVEAEAPWPKYVLKQHSRTNTERFPG